MIKQNKSVEYKYTFALIFCLKIYFQYEMYVTCIKLFFLIKKHRKLVTEISPDEHLL